MADNDEYQFTELDPINPNAMEEEQSSADVSSASHSSGGVGGTNVKRNAIIAVGIFFCLMLAYKFVGSYFTNQKTVIAPVPSSMSVPPPAVVEPQPDIVPPPKSLPAPEPSSDLQSKMSTIELNQENLTSEVSTANGKIESINTNVEMLTAKITELNQAIATLSDKLEAQSHEVEKLSIKPLARPNKHIAKRVRQYLRYYVQAVIPGRAWLVGTNGSTLTVREGSTIAGYGLVKLIDPNQGRVITSSGQVIRFSQDDS